MAKEKATNKHCEGQVEKRICIHRVTPVVGRSSVEDDVKYNEYNANDKHEDPLDQHQERPAAPSWPCHNSS